MAGCWQTVDSASSTTADAQAQAQAVCTVQCGERQNAGFDLCGQPKI